MPRNETVAGEWFVLAMVRVRYDAMRCADPTAANGIGMLGQIAPDVAKRLQDKSFLARSATAVLSRKDVFGSKVSPLWACTHGLQAVQAGLEGKQITPTEALLPPSEWPAIESRLRQQLQVVIR